MILQCGGLKMEGKNKIKTKLRETEIGKISEEWEELRISEVCDITSSKRIFLREYVKSGIPFYRSKEIILKANNNEIVSPFFITEEKYQEIKTKFGVPQEGDILLTSVGTLGIPYCIGVNERFYFKDGNLTWLKDYKHYINNRFLLYWLRSPLAKRQIEMIAIGSTQRALTIDALKKMVICIPKYDEQCRIVKILSDLDSKIELHQKINKTLTAIGQAIFKHWFVDFESPNNEGKPYKSSGGEMVDSKLGAIPKGWRVVELKDCGNVICGKTPPTGNKDNYGDEMPFITIPDMRGQVFVIKTGKKLSLVGAKTQKKKELPHLSVCVSCIATPGLVALTSETSHTNQQINSIICKSEISPYFIYLTLSRMSEQIKLLGLGGTATLNLNTGNFSKIKIIYPSIQIMKNFHIEINGIFDKILLNVKEVNILSQIRDSFLPRLMSGRIRTKKGEI